MAGIPAPSLSNHLQLQLHHLYLSFFPTAGSVSKWGSNYQQHEMNWRSVDSKSGPYHDVVFDQEGVSLVRDLSRFLSRELTALNPVDSDSPSAVRQTLKTKKPGVGILKSKF